MQKIFSHKISLTSTSISMFLAGVFLFMGFSALAVPPSPAITLIGANPQHVEYKTGSYSELGATADDGSGNDISSDIVIDASAVDANAIGTYAVTYDVSTSTGSDHQVRTVEVSDTVPPVITLNDSPIVRVLKGYAYTDAGATALDSAEGDLTGAIVTTGATIDTSTIGSHIVSYDVSDSSGNPAVTVNRTVNVYEEPTLIADYVPVYYGDTVSLSATLRDASSDPIAGKTITFYIKGAVKGTAVTDAAGVAILPGVVINHLNGVDIGSGQEIKATFSEEDTYSGAIGLANLDVAQRPITVTAAADSKTYNGTDSSAGVPTITSGTLAAGDSATWTQSFDNKNAGSGKGIIPSGAVNDGNHGYNYNVTFVPAIGTIDQLSLSIKADDQTKVYGATDPALTFSYLSGSLMPGDDFGGAISRDPNENVGNYGITQGTLTINSNYNLSFTNGNFAITAKPITINVDAKSKSYGEADPPLTYSYVGTLVGSDAFSGSLSRDSGEAPSSYAINQGTLGLSANYAITYNGANLTINKMDITLTGKDATKIYGQADPALEYSTTSGTIAAGDSVIGTPSRVAGENVGPYAINQGTISLTNSGYYNLTYIPATLTISPKDITITADNKAKTYGEADPVLTYSHDPLVGADVFSGSLARTAGENVADYPINLGTLSAGANYTLNFDTSIAKSLTIGKRVIAITANSDSKAYDGTDISIVSPSIAGGSLAAGDSFSTLYQYFDNKNAGSAKTIIPVVAIADGNGGNNYFISLQNDNSGAVSPRSLTVTAVTDSKTYDDSTSSSAVPSVVGALAAGDSAVWTQSFDDKNVGTSKTLIPAGAITDGNSGNNYTVAFNSANVGTITPKTLTVTADTQVKTYGNADPVLTYTASGLLGTDSATGTLVRLAGEDVGSYAIATGTVSAGTNYDISYVPANLTISAKPITVTADNLAKTYGDADPVLTYATSTDLVGADAFTGLLVRAAGENVGNYEVSQGTLSLGANYDMTFVTSTFAINKRLIEIVADAKTKKSNEADPALTYQIATGTLAFADVVTGTLSREPGEAIGVYVIGQGTLAINNNYDLAFTSSTLTINSSGGSGLPPAASSGSGSNTITIGINDQASLGQLGLGGLNLMLFIGSQGNFTTSDGIAHHLLVKNIDVLTGEITLELASSPITVKLNKGDFRSVDLDGDGINDVSLKYNGLINNEADLTIKKFGADSAAGVQVLGEKVYADGLLLRTPSGKIYFMVGGKKRAVESIAELRNRYKGKNILQVTSDLSEYADALPYDDGVLLRGPDGKIYFIVDGSKLHIDSLSELKKYRGKKLYQVDRFVIEAYPEA